MDPLDMPAIDLKLGLRQLLESWQRAGVTECSSNTDQGAALLAALQILAVDSAPSRVTTPSKTVTPVNVVNPNSSPQLSTSSRPALASKTGPGAATRPVYIPPASTTPLTTMPPKPKPIPPPAATLITEELPSLLKNAPLPAKQRLPALDIIRNEVSHCVRCPELATARHKTVFGVGDPNAKLCFVGEAPGADEDEQGEPFVGRAGQLLTKIIEACKLSRDQVWICNVLKCRPPNNRPPEPNEVTNCRGYLDRQLEIIRPEVIVCLGATAAKCLLNTEVSIGKLRGKWHDYRGLQVYCTYHPAYLLRNPNAKKDVWADMQVVMRRLGVELT